MRGRGARTWSVRRSRVAGRRGLAGASSSVFGVAQELAVRSVAPHDVRAPRRRRGSRERRPSRTLTPGRSGRSASNDIFLGVGPVAVRFAEHLPSAHEDEGVEEAARRRSRSHAPACADRASRPAAAGARAPEARGPSRSSMATLRRDAELFLLEPVGAACANAKRPSPQVQPSAVPVLEVSEDWRCGAPRWRLREGGDPGAVRLAGSSLQLLARGALNAAAGGDGHRVGDGDAHLSRRRALAEVLVVDWTARASPGIGEALTHARR